MAEANVTTIPSPKEPYEPSNYQEAVNCPDAEFWIPAIKDEKNSLTQNKTKRKCAAFLKAYMVSSKHHVLGTKSSMTLSYSSV